MPRAGLTPDVLVREAAALADEGGLVALSLTALADRVGVRPPSLYKHVGGLDDLRRRLARRGLAEAGTAMATAIASREGLPALRALAAAYRSFVRTRPGLYAATVRAPAGDDEELHAAAAATAPLLELVHGYGITDPDEVVHAARTVRSALHGFADLESAGGFGLPASVDQSHDRLVEGLDAALTAAAARGRGRPDLPPPPSRRGP